MERNILDTLNKVNESLYNALSIINEVNDLLIENKDYKFTHELNIFWHDMIMLEDKIARYQYKYIEYKTEQKKKELQSK